jgi:hypothetical protein
MLKLEPVHILSQLDIPLVIYTPAYSHNTLFQPVGMHIYFDHA